ncbi:response regulator [Paraburkholderia gardini]|jgi:CheY-like chemotaxis protein|uniref:Regulator of RpoS n=1 Tax=Paraburkholderia gardini TaxID=2823469 RepID=A0ABN7QFQ2_9BURK|nr:response regulator [Paraburkholderia gardini]CAG4885555.1 Regulator of RpoS [Paraburkholderia gardini]CAG4891671.1 Regulator of RpoS [Paraburkholderia gardini]
MCTVLLADDNVHDIEALKRVLEHEGHRVLTADNGAEALLSVQRERPDVVITDWNMPLMDGVQLCFQMKRQPALASIPVMMVSASSPPGISAAPWTVFYRKPVSMHRLLERVGELVPPQPAKG